MGASGLDRRHLVVMMAIGALLVGILAVVSNWPSNDHDFIGDLNKYDVPVTSDRDAIGRAKALCAWYAQHERATFRDGADQVHAEFSDRYSVSQAYTFARAATAAYCPRNSA